MILESAEHHFS